MKPNQWSFDDYINMGEIDPFFTHLCRAMMHADAINAKKLARVFPHMMDAKLMSRWDVAPVSLSRPTKNEFEEKPYPQPVEIPPQDSYGWLLKTSGDFFKNLLLAIHFADTQNRSKISTEFPEEVGLYDRSFSI